MFFISRLTFQQPKLGKVLTISVMDVDAFLASHPQRDEVLVQLKCFPSLRLYFANSKIPCHLTCSMVRKKWNAPDFKWWESLDKTSENIVSLILLVLTGGISFEAFCGQAHPTCGSTVSSSSENVNEHSFEIAGFRVLNEGSNPNVQPWSAWTTQVSVQYGMGF